MSAALRGDAQAMLTSAEAFRDPQGWAGIEAAPFAARADGADPDRAEGAGRRMLAAE